ncbi:TonB-dependent receptor domain-containing protein [Vibrio metschnikovii]|uniref:TonB-dependent receptor n=1 Tax=Vibrio metschnikovii TaxID=28172 RepID=A0A9X0R5X3_VIBME|nr:TonB-dependent receptor [Vibrio metschnikovii]EKO3566704.1 TonB-dependent receptor [Vibrio metschnikovii]EKO3770534.1 TonB-dependent receptor [Vibrio metschnikovii]MBC3620969.1 TonB-dependent receptor [Vibrio metschnikovii]MBC5849436.1 TonB-dependent receptor [Vibrio metschnikovii]
MSRLNPTRVAFAVAFGLFASVPVSAQQERQVDETLVVTASGFEQVVRNAPASITVISAEEMAKGSFRDLTDALRSVPGIYISGGGASQDISIRGLDAKYTLILVDGKRQGSRQTRPNSDGPGIEQGWIPPLNMIERIEVVRGPMSSLYGSDAMGGVINIITKKVSDTWNGSLRLESQLRDRGYAGDSQQASATIAGPLIDGLLGVQLSGSVSRRAEDDKIGYYPEQEMNSANVRFDFTPTDTQDIRIDINQSRQQRDSSKKSAERPSQGDYERSYYALSHEGRWEFATSQLSYSHEKTDNESRQMTITNQVVDASLQRAFDDHFVTVGGQYFNESLDDAGNKYNPSVNSLERWRGAFFIEDEWQMTQDFALTLGARFNRDQHYGNEITPRAYAVWQLSDHWTVKGGVTNGFSAPGLREVSSDWGQVTGGGRRNGVILGNPDLKPEKTLNQEIAIFYQLPTGFQASLSLFNTDFKDKVLITTLCDDASNGGGCVSPSGSQHDFIQQRENVDKARIQGIETSFKIPVMEQLALSANYTFTDSEQRSGANRGDPLSRTPRHQASINLDWDASEQLTFWTHAKYKGSEYAIVRGGAVGDKYDAYQTLDIGGNYQVNKETRLLFGIYNLTDTDISQDKHGKVLDGRSYWIGADISF